MDGTIVMALITREPSAADVAARAYARCNSALDGMRRTLRCRLRVRRALHTARAPEQENRLIQQGLVKITCGVAKAYPAHYCRFVTLRLALLLMHSRTTERIGIDLTVSFNEPVSGQSRPLFLGNGILEARDTCAKIAIQRRINSARRNAVQFSTQTRANSVLARKSPVARECMVADAVVVEPLSTAKFPANREKNREFCQIRPLSAILKLTREQIQRLAAKFPTQQNRELFGRTGNFDRKY